MEKVARAFAEQAGYEFHRCVGSGAFKQTFLVSNQDGAAALKILGEKCSAVRTEREIEAACRCRHPNLATLKAVVEFPFEGKIHTCMVEDYLAGGTLHERISAGLFSREAVLALGRDLIAALEYMYQLRLVHRDIKPENIMFRQPENSSPVIVDFGLVRDLDACSVTQSWFPQGPGTPAFAAPEQLNNRKELIDWRSDQFAAGVTLALCLLGFFPHSADGDANFEHVDRVAAWQEPSAKFLNAIRDHRLPVLANMVRPYPVQRVRTPQLLIDLWDSQ